MRAEGEEPRIVILWVRGGILLLGFILICGLLGSEFFEIVFNFEIVFSIENC